MFYLAEFLRTSSSGGSLSDNSEGLLWRGEEGAQIQRGFCNRDQVVGTSRDYCSLKRIRHHKLRNLALFYVWEDARVWAHWNHSFAMHLSYLGPASHSFPSWVPSGCTFGGGCRGWGLGSGQPICLHPASPQGSLLGQLQWLDGYNILCLLIWQATFFIHNC